MPLGQLWNRFRIGIALVIFVTAYARKTTLQGSALLAAALVLYVSWALGGWQWLVPPALLLLAYTFFFPGKITASARTHNVYAVLGVASPGLFWLFLFRIWREPNLFFPYTLAFAIHLALVAWNLLYPRHASARFRMVACVLLAWGLMFVPYVAINGESRLALLQAGVALLICAVTFTLFYWSEKPQDGDYPATTARWLRQAALVLLATVVARML
jgi:phytol kinase